MKKTAPLWITVVALLAVVCMGVTFVAGAVQQFKIQLPYLFELQFIPTKLEVAYDLAKPIEFTYNYTSQQYINAKVQVRNTDTLAAHSGVVEISLINAASIKVASGMQNTGLLGAGITFEVTVPLTWQPGYTIEDIQDVIQPPCQIIPLT